MKFTQTHEWVEQDGPLGTVGITDHAKKELGEIVYVEFPKVGSTVKAGDEVCVLESTKAAADIYSPVSGKIIAINEVLSQSPQKINAFAESEGWLYRIELSNPKEMEGLLSHAQYRQLISPPGVSLE